MGMCCADGVHVRPVDLCLSETVVFPEPEIRYPVLVVHLATAWADVLSFPQNSARILPRYAWRPMPRQTGISVGSSTMTRGLKWLSSTVIL